MCLDYLIHTHVCLEHKSIIFTAVTISALTTIVPAIGLIFIPMYHMRKAGAYILISTSISWFMCVVFSGKDVKYTHAPLKSQFNG